MDWTPISEAELWDTINDACTRMTPAQHRLWENIKIDPVKWDEPSYGHAGGGFWVVAIVGTSVIWFNDIEYGFNLSRYASHGTIDDYACNQDVLDYVIEQMITGLCKGW